MAWATRSPSCTHSSVAACVDASTTGGATPASKASCQRGAHRHHWSPGRSPSKPNSGCGVDRSLPTDGRELQELGRDPGADGVHAHVLGAGVAAAVAVEAGQRVVVAGLELVAQDVLCHRPISPRLGRSSDSSPTARRAGRPRSGRPRRRTPPALASDFRGAWTGRPSTTRAATATVSGMPKSARTSSSRRTATLVMTPPRPSARGGEQEAPHEGVDGCAADQRVAGQVAVDGGERREVGEHEQEGGRRSRVSAKPGVAAPASANCAALARAEASASRSVTRGPGHQAGRCQGQVLVPAGRCRCRGARRGRGDP